MCVRFVVRFKIIISMTMNIHVLWDVTSYRMINPFLLLDLKMEALRSIETPVTTCQSILRNIVGVLSLRQDYTFLECVLPSAWSRCLMKNSFLYNLFFFAFFSPTATFHITEVVSSISWVCLTLRSLTLYIYGAPILDVSRSHTTTQQSR